MWLDCLRKWIYYNRKKRKIHLTLFLKLNTSSTCKCSIKGRSGTGSSAMVGSMSFCFPFGKFVPSGIHIMSIFGRLNQVLPIYVWGACVLSSRFPQKTGCVRPIIDAKSGNVFSYPHIWLGRYDQLGRSKD